MVTTAITTTVLITILALLKKILFALGSLLCWIVGFLTEAFDMVSGMKAVTYKVGGASQARTLLRIFFGNTNINTIYWGMALIGIVMCIGFTIFAIIKKTGDMDDKMKQPIGGILKNCFKGITIILLMNFIISSTITLTTTLMDRINFLITNSQSFDLSYDVTFDEDDYATMARSLNTIGNYSLNASYNSRYNLNSCYNSVRKDLQHLAEKGKFDITYITTAYDENGESYTVNTWQSVLQTIYRSVDDITVDQPLDQYNQKLAEALMEAMDANNNDASFAPLESYHVNQAGQEVGEMVHLDRMIMLLGTMYGHGGNLDKGSGMTDYYRAPYYYGQKDIFDYDQCEKDFDMDLGTWMYLTVIVVGFFFVKEMLAMVFNATARIFNMLLLYISAPPFIAVTPLDDGGKLKQWTTAFIIQSLGLFGTVISLRLVMLFIPSLFNGDIQLFSSARADTFARVFIMFGAIFTARKASGMIVGILADNAGWQAISAGDVGGEARGFADKGVGFGKALGGYALGLSKRAMGRIDNAIDKSKNNSGGGGESKQGEGEGTQNSQPKNMLALGSKTTAREVGPNGEGVSKNGSGTFSTTSKGAGVDYQSNKRSTLESPGSLPSKSKEAEDSNKGRRLTLDSFAAQQSSASQNTSSSAANISNPDNQEGVQSRSKTFEDAAPSNRLSIGGTDPVNQNNSVTSSAAVDQSNSVSAAGAANLSNQGNLGGGAANLSNSNTATGTANLSNQGNLGGGAANQSNSNTATAPANQTNQDNLGGGAANGNNTINATAPANQTNQANLGVGAANGNNTINATAPANQTNQANLGVGAANGNNTINATAPANQTNQGTIGGNASNRSNQINATAPANQTNQGTIGGNASNRSNQINATAPANQTNQGTIGGNASNRSNQINATAPANQTNQGTIGGNASNRSNQINATAPANQTNQGTIGGNASNRSNQINATAPANQTNQGTIGGNASNRSNQINATAPANQTNQGTIGGNASNRSNQINATAPANQTNQGTIGGNASNRSNQINATAPANQTNQANLGVGAANGNNTINVAAPANQTSQSNLGNNTANRSNANNNVNATNNGGVINRTNQANTNANNTGGANQTNQNNSVNNGTANRINQSNLGNNTANQSNTNNNGRADQTNQNSINTNANNAGAVNQTNQNSVKLGTVNQNNQTKLGSNAANQNTQAKPAMGQQGDPQIDTGVTNARGNQSQQSSPQQNNNAALGSSASPSQGNNTTAVRRNKPVPGSVRSKTTDNL